LSACANEDRKKPKIVPLKKPIAQTDQNMTSPC
jgi:hypothetical protein